MFIQVERRVVNKLAAAHESDLLRDGCKVKLVAVATEKNDVDKDNDKSRQQDDIHDIETASIELEVTPPDSTTANRLVIPDTHMSDLSPF